MPVPKPVLEWLLEENNPSIRYRTLTELMARKPTDEECKRTKTMIPDSPAVIAIFAAVMPDGNFRHGRKDKEYGAVYSGMKCLDYLAELGMDRTDPRIGKAVEQYLLWQKADGDFRAHYSCVFGRNLRTLVRLGYAGDPRIEKIKTLLLASQRFDGGYLCDLRLKRRSRRTGPRKSCISGALSALAAFAELPELRNTPQCQALLHYFLKRDVCFRTDDKTKVLIGDVGFPFSCGGKLLEVLYYLTRMGFGKRPQLRRAWGLLKQHRDAEGRFLLSGSPSTPHLKETGKGKPGKWVTFYAYLTYRQKETVHGPTKS